MEIDDLSKDRSKVNSMELNQDIFGIEPNQHVLFEAVQLQRASLRRGTHSVKNRSEVRGGGKKPFRQKGTGNARQGTIRARSEEHTSELQSRGHLVCRLLLEKKKL